MSLLANKLSGRSGVGEGGEEAPQELTERPAAKSRGLPSLGATNGFNGIRDFICISFPPVLPGSIWLSGGLVKSPGNGVFKSVKDLIEAIQNYIKINNQNPKPFVWTKRVDQILEKVNHCKASIVTAH